MSMFDPLRQQISHHTQQFNTNTKQKTKHIIKVGVSKVTPYLHGYI